MRTLVVMAILCAGNAAHAMSGFVRDPGGGYAKLYYAQLRSRSYFTLDGVRRDDGQQLRQQGVTLYAEYGLLPRLQVAASVPLWRANRYSSSDTAHGFGDLGVEIKVGERFGEWHVAAALAPEIPTGRKSAFVAVDGGGRINLPTGDGEWNFWGRLAVSRAFPTLRGYAALDVGYNLRTNDFTDQYGASLEAGHHFLGVSWLVARLRALQTFGDRANPAVPFLYGEGSEYLAIDVGAALAIAHGVFLTLDYTNVAAARRNVYGGSLVAAGIGAQW